MLVDTATALSSEIGGRRFFFCSPGCQRTFTAPDEELRQLRRRVAVALTGVVILAVLRVAVFLGLAAGATVLDAVTSDDALHGSAIGSARQYRERKNGMIPSRPRG